MRNLSKAEKFDVMEQSYSHLPKGRQLAIDEIILELIELDYQKTCNPELANKLKASITACQNEIYELYYKESYSIETILTALQENDFHAELFHFIIECNGLNERALKNAYKCYMDSEWQFQKQYSFFRFYFFTICVNGLYDIDGNRVNPETGFEYRGPYNMRFPSSLLKQWELGASIKNPVLTVHGLKMYSKKTLYENYGFQLNNGMVLQ